MKFGGFFKKQIDEAPLQWRDHFLSYKGLKKRLKLIFSSAEVGKEAEDATAEVVLRRPRIESQGAPESGAERETDYLPFLQRDDSNDCSSNGSNQEDNFNDVKDKLSMAKLDFIDLLNLELVKINLFFVAKEEEYIIRLKDLQERSQRVRNTVGPNSQHDMIEVSKDVVKFHGEMVLLEHYSLLNFIGLGKITKKHDKRTGGILRLVFIQKVLGQPFFSRELLLKLVKQCQETFHYLFSSPEEEEGAEELAAEAAEYLGQDELYRSTMAARRSMQEMRRGSSTYGPFSLPPLHHIANENPTVTSHMHLDNNFLDKK